MMVVVMYHYCLVFQVSFVNSVVNFCVPANVSCQLVLLLVVVDVLLGVYVVVVVLVGSRL